QAGSTTDIVVVSDHGFSTIALSIDIPKILRDAGFDAVTEFTSEPKPGQIMIVGNGGAVLFYVIGHDAAVTRRLVEFLQQTDFAGVIFTREPMDGTFTLDKVRVDNEHAPDVEKARRRKLQRKQWKERKNFQQGHGASIFRFREWVRRFISTKATGCSRAIPEA